jgi:putative ABC transport system permease protein
MLGLIVAAIRRRRAQTLLLFFLATVAATVASAAPGFIAASVQSLAASDAHSATAAQRVISVSISQSFDAPAQAPAQIGLFEQRVHDAMTLPGFRTVTDARITGRVGSVNTDLAYRQDVCAEIVLDGRCPTGSGEVVMSATLAARTGLKAGGSMLFDGPGFAKPAALRLVGVFRPRSPYDVYWGRSKATATDPAPGDRIRDAMLLTPLSTFSILGAKTADVSADLIVTPESFRQNDPQHLLLASWHGTDLLRVSGYTVDSGLVKLTDQVFDDEQLVVFGVPVVAVQLLLLCWFALFVAVRQTGEARRPDVAKLKLHGTRRRDIWLLTAGQSVLPLFGGGVAGYLLGVYLARLTAGRVGGDELSTLIGAGAVAAAAVAVLGGVVAALLAERRMIGEPVAELARRGRPNRPGWRSNLFDVVVLVLALVGAYQLLTGKAQAAQVRGIAVATPILLALVAGLVTARLVPLLAGIAAPSLLRAGRLGSWLVALHLGRRAGPSRVLALLTLAMVVFASTTLSWGVSTQAQRERAIFEVGADRVLTVQAPSRPSLLSAVRAADPDGRYAMAAVQTYGALQTLAVDSTRLAAVVPWQDAYGTMAWNEVGRALRPDAAEPMRCDGQRLRLSATWTPTVDTSGPVFVQVGLAPLAGAVVAVPFGPLRPGRAEYEAPSAACDAARPCRLVSFALAGSADRSAGSPGAASPPPPGSGVILHELTQATPAATVIGKAAFADLTRWRNDLRPDAYRALLTATADGLAITVAPPAPGGRVDGFPAPVYAYDATAPLPVVVAGAVTPPGEVGAPFAPVLGGALAPVRLVGADALVPRLGANALLVDLEYADRLLPAEPTDGTMEVWVAPGAPADLIDRLDRNGVAVLSTDSVADRLEGLDAKGPRVVLRFLLLVSGAGMLLAVGSFGVWASAERAVRGRELRVLRWQGLRSSTVRVAAEGGYLTFVAVAVVVGVVASLILRQVDATPVFAGEFTVLPVPRASAQMLVAAVARVALVWAAAAMVAGRSVVRVAETDARDATGQARRRPRPPVPPVPAVPPVPPARPQPATPSTSRQAGEAP